MAQQTHNFIDDQIFEEPAVWRISVRPVRLHLHLGRYSTIHDAFRRSHLSGLQDGHERVAWHTGPHLQTEITIYLRFEMTSNVWFVSAAESRNQGRCKDICKICLPGCAGECALHIENLLFFYFFDHLLMPQLCNAH